MFHQQSRPRPPRVGAAAPGRHRQRCPTHRPGLRVPDPGAMRRGICPVRPARAPAEYRRSSHTGWDRYWGTDRYGTKNPFLTAAAADWLVERQAALVGIDSVNIDDTSGPARP